MISPILHPPPRPRREGVALVIVLAFLVIISVLIVAFVSNSSTELSAAKNYSDGVTAKQLADMTTNVVMGQILDATRAYTVPRDPNNPSSNPSGKRLTWASQPGLIRTFTEDGVAGNAFKLYSCTNMVEPPDGNQSYNVAGDLSGEVPSEWPKWPAFFTDLNEPVLSEDPNGQIVIDNKKWYANYPIVDPLALADVEGFKLVTAPGGTPVPPIGPNGIPQKPSATANPTGISSSGISNNFVPMPGFWLYVLKDGTITAPFLGSKPSDGRIVTWANLQPGSRIKPSLENPIVGRIAFWTDDDSSKVNINTAAEGRFWDRPWADSNAEKSLGQTLPTQNEFNRFAGHPALTCLSTVFGKFNGGFLFPVTQGSTNISEFTPYLGLGTTNIPGTGLSPRINVGSDVDPTSKGVRIKGERLYASIDEVMFKPIVSGTGAAQTRVIFDPRLNRTVLDRARFFITANSRAPEINVFSQPRISLWPLQRDENQERNAKDKLIAFCSTANPNTANEARYYFQRFNKYTGDGRTSLANPVPSSQDPTMDWDNIPRNRDLYEYLRFLTGSPIPGYGGSFLTKYTDDRDQILTEMVDYIRSQVNTYSTALTPKYDFLPSRGFARPGETQAIPLYVPTTDTMGFGRFSTITEAALVFYATRDNPSDGGAANKMRAVLLLEPFCPVVGPASWSPHVRYVVGGMEGFKANNDSFGFLAVDPNNLTPRNFVTSRVGYSGGGHCTAFMGLQAGLRWFNDGGTDRNKVLDRTKGEEEGYPFFSNTVPLPTGNWAFNGGTITVSIFSGYDPAALGTGKPTKLVQTLTLEFPKIDALPPPRQGEMNFNNRIDNSGTKLIGANDVVRSVEARSDGPTAGDLRLQTALRNVPKDYFKPHPQYSTGAMQAHSLRSSNDGIFYLTGGNPGGLQTRLVATLNYPTNKEPAAARGVNAALLQNGRPGDWDNGNGYLEDGAYINKVDEGNFATNAEGGYYSRGSFNVEDGRNFSPNRQIASAVAFGSLPTGIKATLRAIQDPSRATEARPWQTLLFTPTPAAGFDAANHPGFGEQVSTAIAKKPPYRKPPDHVMLDFFTMPIVEPYAISEPFSTAGKVNLNTQIAPYSYITRQTGIHAVLKSTKVTAIPAAAVSGYKSGGAPEIRYNIDLVETLRGWDDRFSAAKNNPFVTASQICEMVLVPKTPATTKLENAPGWWTGANASLTGDNAREYPYGHIYPRVTTKSNTFTVHMRVQVLRKAKGSDPAIWTEGKDKVVGEYRGSTTLERYIDSADPNLPDFALVANRNRTMDEYYRFRVLSTKKFTP